MFVIKTISEKERDRKICENYQVGNKGQICQEVQQAFFSPKYYIYWGLESNGKIRERET